MYNRYIPQADGTYKRNQIQSPSRQRPLQQEKPQPIVQPAPIETVSAEQKQQKNETAGSFLRNLLPRNLDTGDLLIIVLLLLLAGDNRDEQNSALLTLALYLFM